MLKQVLVFGGGSGLSNLISGLRLFPFNLKAVVCVSDNGGSTGLIRNKMEIPAFGDLRKVFSAFNEQLSPILEKRYSHPLFKNHPLGNLIMLSLYEKNNNSFEKTISEYAKLVQVRDQVYVPTFSSVNLKALYKNNCIYGEEEIHNTLGEIIGLENYPQSDVNEQVLKLIQNSDIIIFSPGSLYTSTLASVAYPQIIKALGTTKASIVYITNLFTELYETNRFSLNKHIEAFLKMKIQLDYVIVNDEKIPISYLKSKMLESVACDKIEIPGIKYIYGNYLNLDTNNIKHDFQKIGEEILKILAEN